MHQTVTSAIVDGVLIKTDKRGDGFYEIGIYAVRPPHGNVLIAVISRQCVGGKWCLYGAGVGTATCRYRTRKAAMQHAMNMARSYAA